MTRYALPSLLFGLAACGAKTNPSICDQQSLNPNPVCNTACDQTPGAPNTCPAGYHCSPDGACDAQCDATHSCGDGYTCTVDGVCEQTTGPTGPDIDANCPAVHFAAMPVTPSVTFLIDRSGSMDESSGNTTKYKAVRNALTGTNGVVTTLENQVYFGASLFSSDDPCPTLQSVPRAKGNKAAIDGLIGSTGPGGSTPTPPSIDKAVADFTATPPPMGSPGVIVLATDGEPNACDGNGDTKPESVMAAKKAYAAGVKLFILGVGDGISTQHLQDMANAGAGVQAGQPNAPYYLGNDPAQLAQSFQAIIGGVLSCDLAISGGSGQTVDPGNASAGTVTLNGTPLMYGTDWTVDANGMVIHILGAACNTLKASSSPTVEASFPCGSVIF